MTFTVVGSPTGPLEKSHTGGTGESIARPAHQLLGRLEPVARVDGAVFVLLAAGSIALGVYRGYAGHEELVAILAIEAVVVLLFTAMLAWNLATVRQLARRDFPRAEDGSPAR